MGNSVIFDQSTSHILNNVNRKHVADYDLVVYGLGLIPPEKSCFYEGHPYDQNHLILGGRARTSTNNSLIYWASPYEIMLKQNVCPSCRCCIFWIFHLSIQFFVRATRISSFYKIMYRRISRRCET